MLHAPDRFSVVVVDDDKDDQMFITEALQRTAFEGQIVCLEDGNKLLQYLKPSDDHAPPDLILLDLNLPFKDGYEILNEVKRDPALNRVPTIILTSSTRPEDERKCYDLGCDRFYTKPLSMKDYDSLASRIVDFIQTA